MSVGVLTVLPQDPGGSPVSRVLYEITGRVYKCLLLRLPPPGRRPCPWTLLLRPQGPGHEVTEHPPQPVSYLYPTGEYLECRDHGPLPESGYVPVEDHPQVPVVVEWLHPHLRREELGPVSSPSGVVSVRMSVGVRKAVSGIVPDRGHPVARVGLPDSHLFLLPPSTTGTQRDHGRTHSTR